MGRCSECEARGLQVEVRARRQPLEAKSSVLGKKRIKKKHSKRKQMLKIKQFAGHDTFNQLWVTVGPSVCGCVGV